MQRLPTYFRILLVVMTLIGVANLGVRVFEFPALNCSWASNAYGSVTWMLVGMHSTHLITDWMDTVVLTALMFFGPLENKRFMDVYENGDYWYFVVFAWIPIYVVVYFAPRWL